MNKLSALAFQTVHQHLLEHGRPLDQARYRFYFERGNGADVLAELAKFQNADGGFGHALEPDLRTPASSAVATATGCAFLRAVAASPTEPVVERAIDYLVTTYDGDRQRWPIVPPAVEEAPHAPWWTYAESEQNFGGSLINPTASIAGYMYDYPDLTPPFLLPEVSDALLSRLDRAPDQMEMHDLQCWIDLAQARELPEPVRQQVVAKLRRAAPATIERDPQKWASYGLLPLDVAPSPHSFLIEVIDDALIDANLDFWIDQLQPDGSWPIPWNWATVDEQAWAQAERAWKGYQIVNKLLVFRAYNRIEGGS
ncbi:MAG: hypothetical protein DCC55_07740 [Chloroflexi bacterium]|nr:MAG: hypothetical protein DCC55_07740 [Chloroflexota bacterium]